GVHAGGELEQGAAVEGVAGAGGADPVGAGDLPFLLVPQHQVLIVGVEGIQVAAPPRAFGDGAKGDFPQPADLPHDRGIAAVVMQVDVLVVGGLTQQVAAAHLGAQLLAVFGLGNGDFAVEQSRPAIADPV